MECGSRLRTSSTSPAAGRLARRTGTSLSRLHSRTTNSDRHTDDPHPERQQRKALPRHAVAVVFNQLAKLSAGCVGILLASGDDGVGQRSVTTVLATSGSSLPPPRPVRVVSFLARKQYTNLGWATHHTATILLVPGSPPLAVRLATFQRSRGTSSRTSLDARPTGRRPCPASLQVQNLDDQCCGCPSAAFASLTRSDLFISYYIIFFVANQVAEFLTSLRKLWVSRSTLFTCHYSVLCEV